MNGNGPKPALRAWKVAKSSVKFTHPAATAQHVSLREVRGSAVNSNGQLVYNADGVLTGPSSIPGFDGEETGSDSILSAYTYLPHPFMKGDAVSFSQRGERVYGVLSFPCDDIIEQQKPGGRWLEDYEYSATVETIYEVEGEDRFAIGHDHICPLYLERAAAALKDGDGPNPEMLYAMKQIISGESASLNELSYSMDKGRGD